MEQATIKTNPLAKELKKVKQAINNLPSNYDDLKPVLKKIALLGD